jgi:hypothetical protein
MSQTSTALSRSERLGAARADGGESDKDRGPPTRGGAMTIGQFCAHHQISRPTYYKLRAMGLGPVELRCGAIVRITDESAARWRAARENPQGGEAEQVARSADSMRQRSIAAATSAVKSPAHVSNQRTAGRR